MAKTKGVKKHLRRKQQSRKMKAKGMKKVVANYLGKILNDAHLRTYGQEFADPGEPSVVSQIMSHIPSAKTEYKNRLTNALALNTRILAEQKAEIKRLEMSGINGPSRRTRGARSGARPTIDPALLALYLERDYTERAIMSNQYALQKLQNESPRPRFIPRTRVNYAELLRPNPEWDDERMAYRARERGREAYYV
jgi:hypothetical protein